MAQTFFHSNCWESKYSLGLTSFCGPSTLKDRRNLQITIRGMNSFDEPTMSYICLTKEEVRQLREQLERFLDGFSGLQGDDLQEFDPAVVEVH